MEPVRIRDDVDPESREYRRNLIIVIMLVFGLTIIGSAYLGYKIRGAETNAEQESVEQPAAEPADRRGTEQTRPAAE